VGKRQPVGACARRLVWPAIVWLAVLFASALTAPSLQAEALRFVRTIAGGLLITWAVYDLAHTINRQLLVARALAGAGAAVAVVGLAEAAGIPPIVAWLDGWRNGTVPVGDVARISATLPHPNIAAMLLELTFPLLLACYICSPHWWSRGLLAIAMLATIAALVLTFSRAGIAALLLVLFLMGLVALWSRQWRVLRCTLAAAATLLVFVGLSTVVNPAVKERWASEIEQQWFLATYSSPDALTARPGERLTVPVDIGNRGPWPWPATGRHRFGVGYHVKRADGTPVVSRDAPAPLPMDLAPGVSVVIQMPLSVPLQPGEYLVEWDGVQEAVTCFGWRGTTPSQTRLTVSGPPAIETAELVHLAGPTPADVFLLPPPARLKLWQTALEMVLQRPLLGVGPDNFSWVYGHYAGLVQWDGYLHTHSLYLEWLTDTGIIDFVAFGWLHLHLARTVLSPLLLVPSVRLPVRLDGRVQEGAWPHSRFYTMGMPRGARCQSGSPVRTRGSRLLLPHSASVHRLRSRRRPRSEYGAVCKADTF
jgi:hypothetical protein